MINDCHFTSKLLDLLAHVPQQTLANTIILSSIVERVRFELATQLLGESYMPSIVKAGIAKDQYRVSVLKGDKLLPIRI